MKNWSFSGKALAACVLLAAPFTAAQAYDDSDPAAVMSVTLPLGASASHQPHLNFKLLQSSRSFINPDSYTALRPALIDVELTRTGLSAFRTNGVDLLMVHQRLNAEGGLGFGEMVILGVTIGAGYVVYEEYEDQDEDEPASSPGDESGGGDSGGDSGNPLDNLPL